MHNLYKCFLFLPVLIFWLCPVAAQTSTGAVECYTSFIPEVVVEEGRHMLYYELYIGNRSTDTVLLNGMEVSDEKNSYVFLALKEKKLAMHCSRIGDASGAVFNRLLPGDKAVIYIEISARRLTGVKLSHRLQYTRGVNGRDGSLNLTGAAFRVSDKIATPFGSPLAGGPWVAIYEPSWSLGHRRVRYTVDGIARIPGRYAVDFMLLDSAGYFAKGDPDKTANYYSYGADVFAVANGIVVDVRDDFTESATLSAHPSYPAEKATGNFICIRLADHRYVFYEHLKPGTIKVSVGQKVSKGQQIAQVGFTGQTTGPHLHLHVADTAVPLGAEGLPFSFEAFRLLGSFPDFARFGKEGWTVNADTARDRRNERPAPNTVIRFAAPEFRTK